MIKFGKTDIDFTRGSLVVGTVHSDQSLAAARKLRTGQVDLLELRVDAFAADPGKLLRSAGKLRIPLLITVRRKDEGGAGALSTKVRRELFQQFLTYAAAIDVELKSAEELASVIAAARERGIGVILSHHDFSGTPKLAELRQLAARAIRLNPDIFKVATLAEERRDLSTLLEFLVTETRVPLSVMGMGTFGKISRLLAAVSGSVLNYGFLDTANASGQWPALLLKKRIAEVCASAIQQT